MLFISSWKFFLLPYGWLLAEKCFVSTKPLVKMLTVHNLKKPNIVRPTVSQLYIIYEYRISQIRPKKHFRTRFVSAAPSKAWRLQNIWVNKT